MVAHKVSAVLEAVADVSAERDLEALRGSLRKTIEEVLDRDAVRFWRPSPTGVAACDAPFELEATPALRAALADGSAVDAQNRRGQHLRLFPLVGDEVLAVRVAVGGAVSDEVRIVQALLRLQGNFAELIAASEQDRLTGLLNRRSFDAHLVRAAESSLRTPGTGRRGDDARGARWLVMFDVDHFKRINDRFGHLYGDEVLLLLAQLLRRRFRGDDRCFRYGGEEFAVLLAPTEEGGARTVVERLRHDVETHSFPRVGQVTISLGAARLRPGLGPTDVVDLADRALYEAKRGGRNRFVFAAGADDTGARPIERSFGEVELF
jgi:diguanylate cyclase (GGDEF)-like protein